MEILSGLLMAVGGAMMMKAASQIEVRQPAPLEAELVAAYPFEPTLPPDMADLLGRLN